MSSRSLVNVGSCGDSEIDAIRREIRTSPTTEKHFGRRMGLLSSWFYLLQRRGADVGPALPAIEKLQASLTMGKPAVFAAMKELAAVLESLPLLPEVRPPHSRTGRGSVGRDWPLYGGDIHHSASTGEPGPVSGQVAWKFPVGVAWHGRPVVCEGQVYVASPGVRDYLHCLDLGSGRLVWKTTRDWPQGVERLRRGAGNLLSQAYVTPSVACTPVVTGETIILNELGAQSLDGGTRSLTWVDRKSGKLLRRVAAGYADYRIGHAAMAGNSEVVVYPNSIQIIKAQPPQFAGHNRIVCRDAVTGAHLWDFHVGQVFSEPVLDAGQVLVGTAAGAVFCLNLTGASAVDGFGISDPRRVAWQFHAGSPVNMAPAVAGNVVYFGANDGHAFAVNRRTGGLVWRVKVKTEPRAFRFCSTPTVAGRRVYVATAAKELICLEAGKVRWTVKLPDWGRARPLIARKRVLVVAMDGTVCCVSADGEMKWQKKIGTHPVYADPVLAGGRLLFVSSDLRLWCVNERDGAVLWSHGLLPHAGDVVADELASGGWYQSKPTAARGTVFCGAPSRFVFAVDDATGREKWRCELGAAVSGSPAFDSGRIFVGQQGGEDDFYCLDARTGRPLWKQSLGWVWSSANIHDGKVYVPGVDGHLNCLEAATGKILWRHRSGAGAHPEPPVDGGRVFFGSWDHYLYAFSEKDGRLLWQFHTGGSPDSGAPIAHAGKLYVPMGGKRLVCLNAKTGKVLWQYQVEGAGCMNASPALWRDRLVISLSVRAGTIPPAAEIRCLDARAGKRLWRHPGGGITGPSIADGKVYTASTADAFFRCVDMKGRLVWRCRMGERVYESVPAIHGGKAFILCEDGFLYAFA
jgi:outer membrane protein assembly factor BamB